ncbi:DEAD-domain-containing protein [Russula earlei]|uniref:DEAD-domain-containing protein n=1 Tax=Russula earlei TaxID=71964 RepID=A0ACC0U369_9AGAM|nr:DEAD-domain-containing protein [Russula earlei]
MMKDSEEEEETTDLREEPREAEFETFASFANLLSPLILRALADLAFSRPTLVQRKAIPLALENRDVLARARTGSGKTAAYCIPLVQKLLNAKADRALLDDDGSDSRQCTRALILVPTRELAEQVLAHLRGLVKYCESDIALVNVADGVTAQLQRVLLSDRPDVIIGTPSKVLALLQAKVLSLSYLDSLVVDEADLILSYGHDDDIRSIFSGNFLPKVYQSFLMSATMTDDVESLKGLVLRSPVTLRLEEDEADATNLVQYFVRTTEADKFLLTYIILKLKLIQGKCIIFVNDVDRCYRVKLFLEQFSIKSCVLNSELPLNSRYHVVQEFNKGVYDYIIATDESEGGPHDEDSGGSTDDRLHKEEVEEEWADIAPGPSRDKRKRASMLKAVPHKKRRGLKPDNEYGVARGIDFLDVACVLNFDLPTSARAYTHRVGRTARAGRGGTALSFVLPSSEFGKHKAVGGVPSTRHDEEVWERIAHAQQGRVREYVFDKKQVDAFRYRMEDALRAVTRYAIREARLKEIKQEFLTSDKLKAHFEDHPNDLEYLKHDKPLHPTRVQPHMKYVPKYLMPNVATTAAVAGAEPPDGRGRGRGRGRGGKFSGDNGRGGKKKKNDPLRKFR